jgi:hypothetical protein
VANYTELREGDTLPTVGVLQKLLNRVGAGLKVDGVFGSKTSVAVRAFRKIQDPRADGVVDEATWTQLIAGNPLPIEDCIDVFDPALYEGDAKNIMGTGADPLLIGGMSDGLARAVRDIRRRASGVFLLRFIGHGRKGFQGVSDGKGGWDEFPVGRPGRRKPKAIWHDFGDQIAQLHYRSALVMGQSRLQEIFSPYGSIELHGCNVGAGSEGRRFVTTLARALGIPVSAAAGFGARGWQVSTFRFDGPVFTAFPLGTNLSKWCGALPDLPLTSTP